MQGNISGKASSVVDNMSSGGSDSTFPNNRWGHYDWGSQIYAYNPHSWLRTVKSVKEPEIAYYDRAPRRDFPLTNIVMQPNFQCQYAREDVITEMIRGGSLDLSVMEKRGNFSQKLLFRKMLTPSDVGKLNRMVIPRKNASMCFPEISKRMEENEKAGVRGEMQVDFYDRAMKAWKFRFCYWRSSQSYVFTKGWIRFVKDKNLKVNDVVAFYLCEVKREGKVVNKFFMIDPDLRAGEEDSGGGNSRSRSSVVEVVDDDDDHNVELTAQPEMLTSSVFGGSSYNSNVGMIGSEMGGSVFEGSSYQHHHHHVELKPELCSDVEMKTLGKRVMDSESPTSVERNERKVLRLFGVQIN